MGVAGREPGRKDTDVPDGDGVMRSHKARKRS